MDKAQALDILKKTDLKSGVIALKDTKDGLLALVIMVKPRPVDLGDGITMVTDMTGALDNMLRAVHHTLTTDGVLTRVGVDVACGLLGVSLLGDTVADACVIQ